MRTFFNIFCKIKSTKTIDVLLYEQAGAVGYELVGIHNDITTEDITKVIRNHLPSGDITTDFTVYIRKFLQNRLYYSESESKFFFVPTSPSTKEVFEVPHNTLRWAVGSIVRRTFGEVAEYLFTDLVYDELKRN